jgi:hypothetical protein
VLRGRNVVHGRFPIPPTASKGRGRLHPGAGVGAEKSTLFVKTQEIGGDKQLETELRGNVHVRNVFLISVPVPVLEVLDDLFHDLTTNLLENASSRLSLSESTWKRGDWV